MKINTYYFQLTGFHPKLPALEVKSILSCETSNYTINKEYSQCLVIDCTANIARRVVYRAAHCRRAVKLLYTATDYSKKYERIADHINRQVDFKTLLQPGESFLVRVYRIADASNELVSVPLERKLGKRIWDQMNGKCRVQMENPDKIFTLLFVENHLLFGLEIATQVKGDYAKRRPDIRPFFKPGTLEPRFARLMVNLAQATKGEYLLDPFCGPGGILVEGALVGSTVIGVDLDKQMIKGAKKNLEFYSPMENYELLVGDAKSLPLKQGLKSIVTDPPYGKSTSTYGKEIDNLLHQFLEEAQTLLKKGGVIAIGMLSEISLNEIATAHNFELEIFEKIYIHKSLTRRVGVFRKK